ncbi:MAG: lipase family protein [Desulfococcaceae bacterium]
MCRLIYRRGREELMDAAPALGRNDILAEVGMREVRFFYKPTVQCGIFATLPGRKKGFAVLVFRGTNGLETWLSNLTTFQVRWPGGGMVHSGFKKEFFKVWPEVAEALEEIDLPLFFAGHSLGGALALLAASMRKPRAVYTFGCPRVGDPAFAAGLDGVPVYRIASLRDIVTGVPPSRIPFDFRHIGEPVFLTPAPDALASEPSKPVATAAEFSGRRLIPGPPDFLSEHSPVNYTVHLTRTLLEESAAAARKVESRPEFRPRPAPPPAQHP